MAECMKCNQKLTGDDIGIYRKMVHRNANQFLCKACLAEWFGVEEGQIDEKIRQFKKLGCMLFAIE